MRTYAGHSSPAESNALYRRNLAKGQTGLSVAFDLPTQTGYDPDAELARGEVGKVGVPVSHIGDLRTLFDGIPLDQMNTSMTINAPAMYLLALYLAVAEEQGADFGTLSGTTQNDIIKEYLSRGTYVFPPAPSLRLITDMIAYTVGNVPKWNPINVCSYHLQEAGATPVQEVAFALCTAIAVLDSVRDSGQVPDDEFGDVVARISFFVNAGVRFVEEMCKLRAFGELWDEITRERYGVAGRQAAPVPLRRAGQLARSHRGAAGEQRLPDPARDAGGDDVARARGPVRCSCRPGTRRSACRAPGTSSGRCACSRCWPSSRTCSSTRTCSTGRPWSRRRSTQIKTGARAEIDRILEMGGAVAAVESGYLKSALVSSLALRRRRIESGEDVVVGVNRFTDSEPNPLQGGDDGGILTVDPGVGGGREAGDRGMAGRARRGARRGGADRPARRREDGDEPDGALARVRPGGRDGRRVGRRAARGVRRVPAADRGGRRQRWRPRGCAVRASGNGCARSASSSAGR